DRLAAQLERRPLRELLLPVDALPLALRAERLDPVVAVEVEHLVEGEAVAVLKDSPEVVRQRVVDATAKEHGSGGRRFLALDVAPAPRLRAGDPKRVRRGREVV